MYENACPKGIVICCEANITSNMITVSVVCLSCILTWLTLSVGGKWRRVMLPPRNVLYNKIILFCHRRNSAIFKPTFVDDVVIWWLCAPCKRLYFTLGLVCRHVYPVGNSRFLCKFKSNCASEKAFISRIQFGFKSMLLLLCAFSKLDK